MTAYSGPVFIHILFYYCQSWIYGSNFQHTASQIVAFTLINLHFAKRMFETMFVHVFFRITVSFYSVYFYILHYWILSGFFMAYYIYYPSCVGSPSMSAIVGSSSSSKSIANGICSSSVSLLSSSADTEETSLYFLSAVWIFAELSNFETHLILANMRLRFPRSTMPSRNVLVRRAGGDPSSQSYNLRSLSSASQLASTMVSYSARRIPKGYGFDWVSCPNYFFELVAWTMIALITRSFASLLFLTASAMQMWRKAVRKHEMYKKEFGTQYPKFRKVLIPYIK